MSTATQPDDTLDAFSSQPEVMGVPVLPPETWPVSALHDYVVDAFQRSVIFLDVLRQRGNAQEEIAPMATVLRYEYEIIMRGPAPPRPINYYLARIMPQHHLSCLESPVQRGEK